MTIRTERVASLIKEEIGSLLSREYRDPEFGFMTVTDVRMTPDLKIAKVSVSVLGGSESKQKAMKMIERERQHIQAKVGSHLRLKYTPLLQFYLDETLERVDRINQLIRKIHEDDEHNNGSPVG
jgi:ribosome-binding factor A